LTLFEHVLDDRIGDPEKWQNRPLDPLYPVLPIDAIVPRVRPRKRPSRHTIALGVPQPLQ
jgi:transposase-like protein